MKDVLAALFCGCLFGFGLALSGMTDVTKVIGFLDIFGNWDPSLAFVMGGGVLISVPFFQFVLPRFGAPLAGEKFHLPTRADIDTRLVTGAVLFGIGWGLVGLCPGPALASLGYLNIDIIYFLFAMFAGMAAAHFADKKLSASSN